MLLCRLFYLSLMLFLSLYMALSPNPINRLNSQALSPSTKLQPPLVIIVGGGASGFYAAEALIKQGNRVLMLNEDGPIGGGTRFLIRPDKIKLKSGMLKRFASTLSNEHFEGYYGGIKVGANGDITLDELAQLKPSLIYLAAGSRTSNTPNIPGIELGKIYDAYQIAQQYNIAPGYELSELKLSGHIGILGVGNVTADMIVWLAFINRFAQAFDSLNSEQDEVFIDQLKSAIKELSPKDQFKKFVTQFDFTLRLLHYLGFIEFNQENRTVKSKPLLFESKTTDVSVFARRGPFEFKMNPNEAKEVLSFIEIDQLRGEIRRVLETIYLEEAKLNKSGASFPYFTQVEFPLTGEMDQDIETVLKRMLSVSTYNKVLANTFEFDKNNLKLSFQFLTQPIEFLSDEAGINLKETRLARNKLTYDSNSARIKPEQTDSASIATDYFIYSIGSLVDPELGVPTKWGQPITEVEDPFKIPSSNKDSVPLRVSGWNRKPSSGLAGLAKTDAQNATKGLVLKPSQLTAKKVETLLRTKDLNWVTQDQALRLHLQELDSKTLLTQPEVWGRFEQFRLEQSL